MPPIRLVFPVPNSYLHLRIIAFRILASPLGIPLFTTTTSSFYYIAAYRAFNGNRQLKYSVVPVCQFLRISLIFYRLYLRVNFVRYDCGKRFVAEISFIRNKPGNARFIPSCYTVVICNAFLVQSVCYAFQRAAFYIRVTQASVYFCVVFMYNDFPVHILISERYISVFHFCLHLHISLIVSVNTSPPIR